MIQEAIGYIRVSTADQANEGVSLAAQRAKIETWCAANDHALISIHEDAGLSAATMSKRPGLAAALLAVTKGTSLVAYSLSRIARSTRDMIDIAERIEKQGGELVSLTEKIDTSSASGRMVFRMLAVLSEFERDLISERTSTALQALKARGVKLGTKSPERVRAAADARAMQYAEALAAAGAGTLREVAERLNVAGVKTPNGCAWTPTAVSRLRKQLSRSK